MLFERISILDERFSVIREGYVGTRGDRIAYVGTEKPEEDFGETYDGRGKVLLPGLVNTHCHVPMTLLRGYGEGLPLDRWLNERVFPMEDMLTGEFVYWGSLLGIAEMMASGVTSFSDMYFFCDDIIRAVRDAGVSANISKGVTVFDSSSFYGSDDYEKTCALLETYAGKADDIRIDACIHAEYTSNERIVREVAEFAQAKGLPIHLHLSETKKEHEECKQRHGGMTPAAYMDSLGVFDGPVLAAHCVWVEDADIELLAAKGASVAHCPASNLKLGSGVAPVAEMLDRGVRVTIGTDGASSNNNLNMFEELTLAALLARGTGYDPTLLPPSQLLRMATVEGALAQGRRDTGLIRQGYFADLCVVDLQRPHLRPVHDVLANLTSSAQASDVCLTMARGRVVYQDGAFRTIDIERTMAMAENAAEEMKRRLV